MPTQENKALISTLSELIQFISLVMKEFEWYFIQVYLFQRNKMNHVLSGKMIYRT